MRFVCDSAVLDRVEPFVFGGSTGCPQPMVVLPNFQNIWCQRRVVRHVVACSHHTPPTKIQEEVLTAANGAWGRREDWARTTSGGEGSCSKTKKESSAVCSKGKGSGEASRGCYIVKPIGGCQGKNIFLMSGMSGWKRVSKAHQVVGFLSL